MTFHRWKRQFGQMDLNEARRLKELEKENTELKKMLADALLAKRVLEFAIDKNYEPGGRIRQMAQAAVAGGLCSGRAACRIFYLARSTYHRPPPAPSPQRQQLLERLMALSEQYPALRLPPDRGVAAAGRLAGGQALDPEVAPAGRPAGAADQTQGRPPRPVDGIADEGHAPRSRVTYRR